MGSSPWGGKEMDTTEQLTISFQLLIKAHQLEKQSRKKNNVPRDTFNSKISIRTHHEISLQQSHCYGQTIVHMLRKIQVIQQSDKSAYLRRQHNRQSYFSLPLLIFKSNILEMPSEIKRHMSASIILKAF